MGIGLLFPGQASQFPGMGKDLHDAYPAAREVFREASEARGFSVAELCFSGSEEDLRRTENTQPSIFTVSVAAYRVLEVETGIRPLCAAGHSLGERGGGAGELQRRKPDRDFRERGGGGRRVRGGEIGRREDGDAPPGERAVSLLPDEARRPAAR